MIRFLFKGLLRDKSRSLLPVIVVTVGVMMTVFLQAYLEGILTDSIEESARLTSGHVKITTRAYHDNSSQLPNEFAVTETANLMDQSRSFSCDDSFSFYQQNIVAHDSLDDMVIVCHPFANGFLRLHQHSIKAN